MMAQVSLRDASIATRSAPMAQPSYIFTAGTKLSMELDGSHHACHS